MTLKFPLGDVVITRPALATLERLQLVPLKFIGRHASGDWGDLDAHDKRANELALKHGDRVLSAYNLPNGAGKIYVITEHDRSSTCLMLASDY